MWSSLTQLSPDIQTLSFNGMLFGPFFTPALQGLVCALHDLRELDTAETNLTNEVITHLGDLRHLTKLGNIHIRAADLELFNTNDGRFSRLEKFDFSSSDWLSAALVMGNMACKFINLYITIDDGNTPQSPVTIRAFTTPFLQHPARFTLTRLRLFGSEYTLVTDIHDAYSVYKALEPLFACTALQSVDIKLRIVNELDDSWLAGAASAWPSLQRLNIKTYHSSTSNMTLAGFIPILRNCPHLSSLGFSIHATPVDPTLLSRVGNTLVEEISIGSSTVRSPAKVARSLISMFPNLWEVTFRGEERAIWGRIQQLLELMSPDDN
jgi:hypothetical protein